MFSTNMFLLKCVWYYTIIDSILYSEENNQSHVTVAFKLQCNNPPSLPLALRQVKLVKTPPTNVLHGPIMELTVCT